jgi:hypothetical protein
MRHLYELSDQYRGLMRLIDSGEVDPQALEDTLEGLQGDIQAKGAGTLAVLANLAAGITAYDNEIKRMQARKKTLERNRAWLKNYLRDNMQACGIQRIESELFTATLGLPPIVCEIYDEDLIPDEFVEVVPEVKKYPKATILKALKEGREVPGARLAEGQYKITIK